MIVRCLNGTWKLDGDVCTSRAIESVSLDTQRSDVASTIVELEPGRLLRGLM